MAYQISRVSYFTAEVEDRPGEAVRVLSQVRRLGDRLVGICRRADRAFSSPVDL